MEVKPCSIDACVNYRKTVIRIQHSNLLEYVRLIESFVANEIDAQAFEALYLEKFKNDPTEWTEPEYEVLNDLFSDIDAFCANPQLRGSDDLDEDQLRNSSELALRRIQLLAVK
jgi:hypothetical protein